MIKPRFTLLFCICLIFQAEAQLSDKMRELLDYPETKQQTIQSGRRVIYERFVYKDSSAVKEIFDYLTTFVEDDQNCVFYADENMLFNYWLNRPNKVLSFVQAFDSLYLVKQPKKKFPRPDGMSQSLIDNLKSERKSIYTELDISRHTEEEKTLLKLNFDQILSWSIEKDSAVETLKLRALVFLQTYPNSPYKNFVNTNLGLEFKRSKWSFAAEFFTGFGFYNGNMNTAVGPIVPARITAEVSLSRVALRFIDYIGFARTQDSVITDKARWRPNAPARVWVPGLVLGYYLVNKKAFKLCPYIGISSSSVGPPLFTSDKPKNKNTGFEFTSTLTYGLSMEFFLNEASESPYNWISRDLHYFRLSYTFYQPKFERKYPGYSGAMHSLTLGYVMFENPKRRIK